MASGPALLEQRAPLLDRLRLEPRAAAGDPAEGFVVAEDAQHERLVVDAIQPAGEHAEGRVRVFGDVPEGLDKAFAVDVRARHTAPAGAVVGQLVER